ncbi:MAG: hypothetical protein U5R06_03355 [candidate division KSB1 bacterium]|nr:hypothetical protein [candidate division KSB1 bacterium]
MCPSSLKTDTGYRFFSSPIQDGTEPYQLSLTAEPPRILNQESFASRLCCYLLDREGRLCREAAPGVEFQKTGPGEFSGETTQVVKNGVACIDLHATPETGAATIIAASDGLVNDTVEVLITDRMTVDSFDAYQNQATVESAWSIRSGTQLQFRLESEHVDTDPYALRVSYGVGSGYAPYAALVKKLHDRDFSAAKSIRFWLKPDELQTGILW